MQSRHQYLDHGHMILKVGDVCDTIYVVLFGTIEIGLSDGQCYQKMDLLGKGSVIGVNGILTNSTMSYSARVKSKRVNLLQIS